MCFGLFGRLARKLLLNLEIGVTESRPFWKANRFFEIVRGGKWDFLRYTLFCTKGSAYQKYIPNKQLTLDKLLLSPYFSLLRTNELYFERGAHIETNLTKQSNNCNSNWKFTIKKRPINIYEVAISEKNIINFRKTNNMFFFCAPIFVFCKNRE